MTERQCAFSALRNALSLLLIVSSGASAQQERRSGFTIAADLHVDITHITDFTPRGWARPTNGLGNRGAGGGAANRVGFGVEVEHEGPTRRAWLASAGVAEGWTHYRQHPDLSRNNQHHIKYFNTYALAVGTRQYLRSPENRVRAFGDVSVGYEHLVADLFYHNTVTDTVVHTGGPLARARIGSQWRLRERISGELALQWQLAHYGVWVRDGKSIPGKPAKLANYTFRTAVRVRL